MFRSERDIRVYDLYHIHFTNMLIEKFAMSEHRLLPEQFN